MTDNRWPGVCVDSRSSSRKGFSGPIRQTISDPSTHWLGPRKLLLTSPIIFFLRIRFEKGWKIVSSIPRHTIFFPFFNAKWPLISKPWYRQDGREMHTVRQPIRNLEVEFYSSTVACAALVLYEYCKHSSNFISSLLWFFSLLLVLQLDAEVFLPPSPHFAYFSRSDLI